MIKAITFDFWNTLYKTPQGTVLQNIRLDGLTRVMKTVNNMITRERVFAVFMEVWKHVQKQQRSRGLEFTPDQQLDMLLRRMDIDYNLEIWDKAYYYYAETLLEYPPQPNDSVLETLPLLAARYKLGLICNTGISPGTVLRQLMERDGIIGWFDQLTFSNEVGCSKPNRGIFQHTLDRIGVSSYEAAHIGDDKLTDIVGAKIAGMTAIWLAPGEDWKIPEADYHLHTIRELLGLW